MALYPCDSCGSRYLGKASAIYAAIDPGAQGSRLKLRMCPPCFKTEAEEQFSAFAVTIRNGQVEPTAQLPLACCGCASTEGLAAAFITTYPAGQERTDYFGRLCPVCAQQVLERLAVSAPLLDAIGTAPQRP